MRRTRLVLVLVQLTILVPVLLPVFAQTAQPSDTLPPGKNPHLGNAASIKNGLTLYRVRCGDCHGLDARGYRGPDLTAVLGGMPDERSVPDDPQRRARHRNAAPAPLPDDDVLMIIAYLGT